MIPVRLCVMTLCAAALAVPAMPSATSAAPTVVAQFAEVSCVSSSECFAAGTFIPGGSGPHFQPLVERFDGKAWSVMPVPAPAVKWSRLFGLSCASATDCFAVGEQSEHTFSPVTLAEHWDGTRWSIVPTPVPPKSFDSELNGVSCFAPGSCMAVGGQNFNGPGTPANLAERWDGTRWSVVPVPDPPSSASGLLAVSCPAAAVCEATGSYGVLPGAFPENTLTERWDGTSWQIVPSPNPPPATESTMFAVSCDSATDCKATGESFTEQHITDGTGSRSLAEQGNGTQWSLVPARNPAGSAEDQLSAVSCSAPRQCMAVGSDVAFAGSQIPLAERWDGTRWSTLFAPNPPLSESGLNGLSCPRPTLCVAVGAALSSFGGLFTLAEEWQNGAWHIIPTPSP